MKLFSKTIFVSIFYITGIHSYSQILRHPNFCDCKLMCFKNKKIDLVDTNLQMPPFNMVLHLGVKFRDNDHEFYSTASFISSNILLIARHCVTYPGDTIQFIELCLSSPGKDKWIKLTANDFKIYEYEKKSEPHIREQEEDIALIKILNKTKLQALYKKPFSLPDSTFLSVKKLYEIHLTGFPCSKFSINKYSHDTLVDRSATDSIQKATNQDLLGFTLCFCAGDSGGPIWIKSNNQFYIIAIAESPNFRSYQGIDKNKNIGVLISNQTVNWIKSIFDN